MQSSLSTNTKKQVNIIFVGTSGVGKTCVIDAILGNKHDQKKNSTAGIPKYKLVKEVRGKQLELTLHDTAGQEEYKLITRQFYRECHAIVFVFSDDHSMSLRNCINFGREFKSNYSNKKEDDSFEPVCMLLRNKIDMQKTNTDVTIKRTIQEFADLFTDFPAYANIAYSEASALTSEGITAAIDTIVERLDSKGVFKNMEDSKGMQLKPLPKKVEEKKSRC